jgi:hypothetical protein
VELRRELADQFVDVDAAGETVTSDAEISSYPSSGRP